MLVIDDTSLPKKGERSVGVAAQYASALGKTANCQTLVSLTLARGEVPVMVALRLFLPDSWTSNASRLKRARVPVEHRTPRSKPEIALAEIDRAMAANVRFGCVLADAGYGLSAPFRQGLTERGLAWAVGIPRHLKVYVKLIWPTTKVRGKPRKHHVPDILSIAAEQTLASAKWKAVSWRSGTKGRLKARFAALRVRTADGPPQRIWDKGQQHLPGDEAWPHWRAAAAALRATLRSRQDAGRAWTACELWSYRADEFAGAWHAARRPSRSCRASSRTSPRSLAGC
ncbi:SRSO17 transposase [Bradyrhizobium elkanii]